MRVPMSQADTKVIEAMKEILSENRIHEVIRRREDAANIEKTDVKRLLTERTAELQEAEAELGRLYQAVSKGAIDPEDQVFIACQSGIDLRRQRARSAIEVLKRRLPAETYLETERVARLVQEAKNIVTSDEPNLKKRALSNILDYVEIDERKITIVTSAKRLTHIVTTGPDQLRSVPTFVREWRRRWACRPTFSSI